MAQRAPQHQEKRHPQRHSAHGGDEVSDGMAAAVNGLPRCDPPLPTPPAHVPCHARPPRPRDTIAFDYFTAKPKSCDIGISYKVP